MDVDKNTLAFYETEVFIYIFIIGGFQGSTKFLFSA